MIRDTRVGVRMGDREREERGKRGDGGQGEGEEEKRRGERV